MKKHKILLIAICGYVILGIMDPTKVLIALKESKYYFIEMLQILPAVFVLTSMIQTWIPTQVIMKYFGKNSGVKGYFVSIVIGSLSAGPIYAAFPVCQTLLKKGARVSNVVIILSTWAVVKVPMLINEVKFMGLKYMIFRWTFTILAIFIMAYLMEKLIETESIIKSDIESISAACILCNQCIKNYPDTFKIVDGKVKALKVPTQDEIGICPVGAIKNI